MRRPETDPVAQARTALPADRRGDAPAGLVCLALALSLLVLASRIASIW